MRALILGALVGLMSLFTGCATTTLTFNEQVGVGYGVADSIAKLTDQLVLAGKLSKNDATNVIQADMGLMQALGVAQTTYAANQAAGSSALTTALAALNAIASCLATPATVPTCVPAVAIPHVGAT